MNLMKMECTNCEVPMVFTPNIECTETKCTVEDLFRDRQGVKGDWVVLGFLDCLSNNLDACTEERLYGSFADTVFKHVIEKIEEWAKRNEIEIEYSDKPLFLSDATSPQQLWFKLKRGNAVLRCHLKIDDEPEETEIDDNPAYYYEISMVCQ